MSDSLSVNVPCILCSPVSFTKRIQRCMQAEYEATKEDKHKLCQQVQELGALLTESRLRLANAGFFSLSCEHKHLSCISPALDQVFF